ncbi:MAG: 3-deoxy-D-manno-octulosonic acid transferase [Bacteroidales bacterium]|nr:3-deoxy-D-manno-octulosonic acid transferase [Bacteroidales bacterium]
MIKGRRGLLKNLRVSIPPDRTIIWFHAASLGEFEQGRPVIETWKASRSDDFILLTFFSSSGYEMCKDYEYADYVCYLPFDFPIQIKKFIQIAHPRLVVLIKYEFWPNLLLKLQKHKTPVFLISALFRSEQHFFKWYGFFFRRLLRVFDLIFVQNEESKSLLEDIGIVKVQLAGDTRVDRVLDISEKNESIEGIEEFKGESFVLLAGSSWEPEEEMIDKLLRRLDEKQSERALKIILAPHDIGEEHLKRIEIQFSDRLIRYSEWINSSGNQAVYSVLLIDQIGLLSRLYKYADLAFIGGGFGRGLHNVLEPAAYGIPVIFGPDFSKFTEAKELVRIGGSKTITSSEEFEEIVLKYMYDNKKLSNDGAVSRGYVENSKGATGLIASRLMENV